MKNIPPGAPSSLSYDELAERQKNQRPLSAERAQRRGEGGPESAAAQAERMMEVPPQDITGYALSLGTLQKGLQVPLVDGETLRVLSQRIDESAGFVTPILCDLLRAFPKVASGTGMDPDQLAALARQRTEMFELAGTAAQLRADAADSRRQTSALLRRDMKALVSHIRAQLQPGRLPKKEQDRLRSDAMELLAAWEKVEQQPLAERSRTLKEKHLHTEQLAEEEEQTLLVRTMLALHNGEPVDQSEWDHAAEIYDALCERSSSPAPARRTSRR